VEERTSELRQPAPPSPPWYRENWWIFLVALLLIVGGIIAFFALRGGGGGEERVVPNVLGLREAEARSVLEQRGFAVDAVRKPSADPPQTVIEQHPGVGSRLERGGRVTITVSTGPPGTETETETETQTETETETETVETTSMPDLEGAEYPDAVEQLLDAGLFPDSSPVDSSEERGTVVAQRPEPGERLAAGSAVRLNVSLGAGERARRDVPDLTGEELPDALRDCAEAGFTCRVDGDPGEHREVSEQRPAAGQSAPELSQIVLVTGE
jgi:beta-lactam-binding protein with PASTA domain